MSTFLAPGTPKIIELNVQGKSFAAELWGEAGASPVIALHGWLDNCHSFRPLAPLLNDVQILALDLAGHGHSEHRSADASYHIWDDVREVLLIAREMGWERFSLLGHSRGAIIAAMVAAVAPESVNRLVLLEGLLPQTMSAAQAVVQLKKFIDGYFAWNGLSRGQQDIERMVQGRMQAGFGLSETAARLLTLRNIEQVDGYYYRRTDARLNMPSPQMLTAEAADSFVDAISVPTLLVLAAEALGKSAAQWMERLAANSNISVMILPGNHHLHMEESRGQVAEQVNRFMGAYQA